MDYKSFFKRDSVKLAIFIGLIAFVIRLVPEYLIGHYPIGYDTFTAYTVVMSGIVNHTSNYLTLSTLTSQNFLYSFFQIALSIHHFDILFLMKAFGLILYALLALSTYLMLLKGLRIEPKKAFYITLFYIISLAALRVSWDLFRNELGLIFLNLFLIGLFNLVKKFDWCYLGLALASTLLVFMSHQIVSLLLLFILFCFAVSLLTIKYQDRSKYIPVIGFILLIALSPIYLHLDIHGLTLFVENSDSTLIGQGLYLYLLMYGAALIFVIIGLIRLFKSQKLIPLVFGYWFIGLSFIAIEPYIFSTKLFFLWDRWLYMLALPVAILAFYGVEYVAELKLFKPLATEVVLLFLIVLVNYRSLPFTFSTAGIRNNIPSEAAFPHSLAWNSIGEVQNNDVDILMNYLKAYQKPYVLVADGRFTGLFSLEGKNFLGGNKLVYTYNLGPAVVNSLRESNQAGTDILVFDANDIISQPGVESDIIYQTNTPDEIHRYIYKLSFTNVTPTK